MRPREVAPGVSGFPARTPTLLPATHTNSYALGTRQIILVEPATPFVDERREWIGWARALQSQGREILAIVTTHHHVDHVGGAADLSRELGLPLWGHAKTAALTKLTFARHLDDGHAIVLDGPTPQAWNVLHTPGHASDHICLWEPTLGALVVGDMVASVGTILIAPGDGHMVTYLDQLARLSTLGAKIALPAHGDSIPAPDALFQRFIVHRAARESRVLSAITSEPRTVEAILPIAYFDAPEALWPIARLSLLAHLEKLVEEGQVTLRDDAYSTSR